MATHKSALKQHRQSVRRRVRNRANRSRVRSAIKHIRTLIATDAGAARKELPAAHAAIDRAIKLGALHHNAGARTKSRLARALAAKS